MSEQRKKPQLNMRYYNGEIDDDLPYVGELHYDEETGLIYDEDGDVVDEKTLDAMLDGVDAHILSERMGEGVGSARTAGEVLATMDANAALTLDRIRQIAESTREQSTASGEIVNMVGKIASGSDAIAQAAGRNADQAQSLQRLSGELQSMLARFKV